MKYVKNILYLERYYLTETSAISLGADDVIFKYI